MPVISALDKWGSEDQKFTTLNLATLHCLEEQQLKAEGQ